MLRLLLLLIVLLLCERPFSPEGIGHVISTTSRGRSMLRHSSSPRSCSGESVAVAWSHCYPCSSLLAAVRRRLYNISCEELHRLHVSEVRIPVADRRFLHAEPHRSQVKEYFTSSIKSISNPTVKTAALSPANHSGRRSENHQESPAASPLSRHQKRTPCSADERNLG